MKRAAFARINLANLKNNLAVIRNKFEYRILNFVVEMSNNDNQLKRSKPPIRMIHI